VLTVTALIMMNGSGALAQPQADPPLAPSGRLIDVGGWRLHLNCLGESKEGRPTVILEPGIGDFSVEWSLVQPRIASAARVCSYDRAGDGWSDLGPYPRTLHQIVYELHTLLERANVRPPYVLVGHSYGGWLVQLYASDYRAQVAGVVGGTRRERSSSPDGGWFGEAFLGIASIEGHPANKEGHAAA